MGGSSKQTQTTQSDPWAPAQPYLKQALDAAGNAFNTTYQGTGVAGMDPLITQAKDAIANDAQSGVMGNLAGLGTSNILSMLGGGGLTQQQQKAEAGTEGALGGFNATMGQAQAGLVPYATGEYLGKPNPYLDQAVDTAMSRAGDRINQSFSAAGRYGSGAHGATAARELGGIANNAYMQDYNQQQQNQMNAASSLSGMAGAGLSGNLSGYGQIGNLGQQGVANTQGAISNFGALDAARNTDATNLLKVGGLNMDYQQQLIDAANQNPWQNVQNLASIAGGIGGLGGTSTATKTQSGGNTMLGGILGGLGAFKNLGGLSGIASLFSLSDERSKENIEKVGKLDDGQPIYAYNYKGDGRPQIGLLAQEVEKVAPDAVATDPRTGMKAVNYHAATRKAAMKGGK